MCEPTTLMIAAGVASAAGSIVQGYSALQQGKYEAGVNKVNARLEHEAARDSLVQGQFERRKFWRDIGRVKGQNIAAMAASGIDVDFGAGERLQEDTNELAREDAANLYQNIHQRTRGFIINEWNYKQQAKAAKQRGKSAFIGSLFQAGSSLLGAASQASGMKAKMGTSSAGSGG